MDDPLLMRRLQSSANLPGDAEGHARSEAMVWRLFEQLGERVAPHAFHADEVDALRFAVIVRAKDVAMGDFARQSDFALESLQVLRRTAHHIAGKCFDRDAFVELRIGRFVDDPHSTAAQDLFDAIAVCEHCSRDELDDWSSGGGGAGLRRFQAHRGHGRGRCADRSHHAGGDADQRHRRDRKRLLQPFELNLLARRAGENLPSSRLRRFIGDIRVSVRRMPRQHACQLRRPSDDRQAAFAVDFDRSGYELSRGDADADRHLYVAQCRQLLVDRARRSNRMQHAALAAKYADQSVPFHFAHLAILSRDFRFL